MLTSMRALTLLALLSLSIGIRAELPLPIASLIERQMLGNHAEISQHGAANSIWLEQLGQANVALLQQVGVFNQIDLTQQGYGNQAVIRQFEQANQVTIMQQGDFNLLQIEQYGGSGFSLQQIGNGAEATLIQFD